MAIQLENKGQFEKKKNFWLHHVNQVHLSTSEMDQIVDYFNQNISIITSWINSIRIFDEKNLDTMLRVHEQFEESQCVMTHQAKQLFDSIFQYCQFSDILKRNESIVENWANFAKKFKNQLKMLNYKVILQLNSQKGPRVNMVKAFNDIEKEGKFLQQIVKPYIEFLSKNYRIFELDKQYQNNMKYLTEMQNTFAKFSGATSLLQSSKLLDILRARDENKIHSIQTIPFYYYPPNRVMTKREFYSLFDGLLEDFGESIKEKTLAQTRGTDFSNAGIRQRVSNPTPALVGSELKLFPLGDTPMKDLQVILIVEESGTKMIKFYTPRKDELIMTLAEAGFSHKRNEEKPLKIWVTLDKLASKRGKPVHLKKLKVSLLNKELMRILQIQDRPIRCVKTGLYRPLFQCRVLEMERGWYRDSIKFYSIPS